MDIFEVKTERAVWKAYKCADDWKIEGKIGERGIYVAVTAPKDWGDTRVFQCIASMDKGIE